MLGTLSILSSLGYLLILFVVKSNAFPTATRMCKKNNIIKINRHSFLIPSQSQKSTASNSDENDSFERFRLYLLQFKSREFRRSTLDYLITGFGELKQSFVDCFHMDSYSRGGRYFAAEVLFSIIAVFGCPIVLQILLHSLAVTLQLVGAVVSIVSIWTIRKSFSLFEAPRNILSDFKRTGPYQYIRHPIYAGVLMYLLGSVVKSRDMYRLLGWFGMAIILVKNNIFIHQTLVVSSY